MPAAIRETIESDCGAAGWAASILEALAEDAESPARSPGLLESVDPLKSAKDVAAAAFPDWAKQEPANSKLATARDKIGPAVTNDFRNVIPPNRSFRYKSGHERGSDSSGPVELSASTASAKHQSAETTALRPRGL